jgi:hypothetical protein
MTIFGYVRCAATLALLAVPGSSWLLAQPAIAPATSIRVIEIVDPYSGARDRQVAEDLTPAEISRLQHALAAAGFDPGRATGEWNGTTRLALGRFQAARGLARCDCVTYETLISLRIRPEVVASIRAPLDGGYGARTVLVLPGRERHFGHGSGVVAGLGSSVFVGHQPVLGGQPGRDRFHDRPPHFRDRGRDRGHDGGPHLDPRPSRPRPGDSTSRSGAPLRSLIPSRP